jgi:hypothetical protein
LAAGASGYLKKEASWQQVLSTVREALAARARLESELAGAGEVRGNLEGTGVVSLLRSVRRTRPDARVTLRDAWNLFECELREGRLAQLTRTASDGSFVRGEAALPQLLGASAGRYAVTVAQGPLKQTFEGSLDEVLTRGALALGSQLDALSFPLLSRVARVVFDEDAYPSLLNQSPAVMRDVVERLHAGEPPAKLAQRGDIAQATLEAILLDMGRRGAIRGVVGSAGEDLFAEARLVRGREAPVELASPRSVVPPSGEAETAEQSSDGKSARVDPSLADASGPGEVESSSADESRQAAGATPPSSAEPASAPLLVQPALEASLGGVDEPAQETGPVAPARAEEHDEASGPVGGMPAPHPVPTPLERRDSGIPPAPTGLAATPAGKAVPAAATSSAQPVRVSASASAPRSSASSEPRPLASTSSDRRAARSTEPAIDSDPAAVEARRSRSTLAAWAVALLALFAAAFFAERLLEPQGSTRVEAIGGGATKTPAAPAAAPATEASSGAPAAVAPEPSGPAAPANSVLVVPEDSGFQIFNGILEPGLVSAPNQGLLVVEATARLAGAELSVDQQRVGTVPTKLPLSEGIHELAIRRGDAVSYRFVSVRPGKTWVLREP